MDNEYVKDKIKRFLDDEGRLKAYPAKHKQKVFALYYLASKFTYGVHYTEKEINQILKAWHSFDDWVMLRRDLYDFCFLGREPNGSVYWLRDEAPTFATFGLDEDVRV